MHENISVWSLPCSTECALGLQRSPLVLVEVNEGGAAGRNVLMSRVKSWGEDVRGWEPPAAARRSWLWGTDLSRRAAVTAREKRIPNHCSEALLQSWRGELECDEEMMGELWSLLLLGEKEGLLLASFPWGLHMNQGKKVVNFQMASLHAWKSAQERAGRAEGKRNTKRLVPAWCSPKDAWPAWNCALGLSLPLGPGGSCSSALGLCCPITSQAGAQGSILIIIPFFYCFPSRDGSGLAGTRRQHSLALIETLVSGGWCLGFGAKGLKVKYRPCFVCAFTALQIVVLF